jgi:hypothetical protein
MCLWKKSYCLASFVIKHPSSSPFMIMAVVCILKETPHKETFTFLALSLLDPRQRHCHISESGLLPVDGGYIYASLHARRVDKHKPRHSADKCTRVCASNAEKRVQLLNELFGGRTRARDLSAISSFLS